MIDLVQRLRALSAHKHDDLSVGSEAADELERLTRELEEARKDAERIQFLEDETRRGCTPNLVFDDDANWAVSYGGFQPLPEGDGKGFTKTVGITCIVEPHEWRPSVRAAIDAAMSQEKRKDALDRMARDADELGLDY